MDHYEFLVRQSIHRLAWLNSLTTATVVRNKNGSKWIKRNDSKWTCLSSGAIQLADEIASQDLWLAVVTANNVYPCTIIPARYGGVYEGARWLAFHCDPGDIPEGATGDDVECAGWWADLAEGLVQIKSYHGKSQQLQVGKADSPDEALLDLHCQIDKSS